MASPTSPTHGKLGAIFRYRKNGFNGSGLNDVTWGTAFDGAATSIFEVEIDATGTPDTFKWRVNGGAYTAGVAITGAAQTLSDSQTITFAATTGHTLGDLWQFGNLKDEATTEAGDEAQITAAANRLLNPNFPPTFTDDGGAQVRWVEYAAGKAKFYANVGNVDVDGNGGVIDRDLIQIVGYLRDWSFSITQEMADITKKGDHWKTQIPGLAAASGQAAGLYIGTETFFEDFKSQAEAGTEFYYLELFGYDPDQDQTGDQWQCWASFTGLDFPLPIGEAIHEEISFEIVGIPTFVAQS